MIENGILHKVFEYGSYILVGIIGFFLRRHIDKSDMKEKEQDTKLENLDKRVDDHDVSRAEINTKIDNIYRIQQKMDRNIDKLLDK